MSCVNDKISGVFVAFSRPLKDGETPKHPNATWVYEATNELTPAFKEALTSGQPMHVSWKIDGTCCKIQNGIFYRRRDIRKGSIPPPGSILGDVDETGYANIAWVPVNKTKDPESKYHVSAFVDEQHSQLWALDKDKKPYKIALADVTFPITVELIGPQIQRNLYEIETVMVDVVTKKKESVPRHFVVVHGAFEADFPMEYFQAFNPLDLMRFYVKRNLAEGLVFRCGDKYFKVNQGHLGTLNHDQKLLLAGFTFEMAEKQTNSNGWLIW